MAWKWQGFWNSEVGNKRSDTVLKSGRPVMEPVCYSKEWQYTADYDADKIDPLSRYINDDDLVQSGAEDQD